MPSLDFMPGKIRSDWPVEVMVKLGKGLDFLNQSVNLFRCSPHQRHRKGRRSHVQSVLCETYANAGKKGNASRVAMVPESGEDTSHHLQACFSPSRCVNDAQDLSLIDFVRCFERLKVECLLCDIAAALGIQRHLRGASRPSYIHHRPVCFTLKDHGAEDVSQKRDGETHGISISGMAEDSPKTTSRMPVMGTTVGFKCATMACQPSQTCVEHVVGPHDRREEETGSHREVDEIENIGNLQANGAKQSNPPSCEGKQQQPNREHQKICWRLGDRV